MCDETRELVGLDEHDSGSTHHWTYEFKTFCVLLNSRFQYYCSLSPSRLDEYEETTKLLSFYMPGEADGISSRQYSPLPSSPFLYPTFSPLGFLSSYLTYFWT